MPTNIATSAQPSAEARRFGKINACPGLLYPQQSYSKEFALPISDWLQAGESEPQSSTVFRLTTDGRRHNPSRIEINI